MNPMQIRAIVDRTKAMCFACRWISEDLDRNGKLTDWPWNSDERGQFPAQGKLRHLELERQSIDNCRSKVV